MHARSNFLMTPFQGHVFAARGPGPSLLCLQSLQDYGSGGMVRECVTRPISVALLPLDTLVSPPTHVFLRKMGGMSHPRGNGF